MQGSTLGSAVDGHVNALLKLALSGVEGGSSNHDSGNLVVKGYGDGVSANLLATSGEGDVAGIAFPGSGGHVKAVDGIEAGHGVGLVAIKLNFADVTSSGGELNRVVLVDAILVVLGTIVGGVVAYGSVELHGNAVLYDCVPTSGRAALNGVGQSNELNHVANVVGAQLGEGCGNLLAVVVAVARSKSSDGAGLGNLDVNGSLVHLNVAVVHLIHDGGTLGSAVNPYGLAVGEGSTASRSEGGSSAGGQHLSKVCIDVVTHLIALAGECSKRLGLRYIERLSVIAISRPVDLVGLRTTLIVLDFSVGGSAGQANLKAASELTTVGVEHGRNQLVASRIGNGNHDLAATHLSGCAQRERFCIASPCADLAARLCAIAVTCK